jgi:hypothetical protein
MRDRLQTAQTPAVIPGSTGDERAFATVPGQLGPAQPSATHRSSAIGPEHLASKPWAAAPVDTIDGLFDIFDPPAGPARPAGPVGCS